MNDEDFKGFTRRLELVEVYLAAEDTERRSTTRKVMNALRWCRIVMVLCVVAFLALIEYVEWKHESLPDGHSRSLSHLLFND